MPHPVPYPFEVWQIDFSLCAESFQSGAMSEIRFRHHLARLGYRPREIEAEVEWCRQSGSSALADAISALEAA